MSSLPPDSWPQDPWPQDLCLPDAPPALPTTHYVVSISRGDSIRIAVLRPAALWALIALVALSFGVGLAGVLTLMGGDRPGGAIVLRAGEAEVRDRADAADQRREAEALQARVSALVARQANLEKRAVVVGALAEAARGVGPTQAAPLAADALGAIESLGPRNPAARRPADAEAVGGARAYAPPAPSSLPPRPAPDTRGERRGAPAPSLAALAANPELDPPTRLEFVERSLARIENGQMTALAVVDQAAVTAAGRNAAILADAGLDAAKLAARKPLKRVGGPFVPLDAGPDAPAFDRAAARVGRDVAFAEKLDVLMGYAPLGRPLLGAMPVASPFGYRIDPFFGRPALHAGVDLLQPYGAEVRAAGAGRVVHAGPMGGYGEMVEIDHGDGLTSRYGHLSDILVSEGTEIRKGAAIGRLGSTGRSTGPHLHYEVRIDGEPVDPERFLRAGARLAAAR